ncbi:DUF3833 domain-containing protein [Cedecea sp. FDAARGOS_727]|uniref:DUF3833 domain-containing protein n=1 Tax=Cedecea sp. FDAARGOS_727 TaxID=2545798 RepID=UPI00143E3E55|nr:DUF3833 domain-containing protein [Cedecea sp. FDAARGOS_727]QIX98278.1 DUF3833 domain-containing protein [Cedecea sp. FDAARGOS_727]
MNRTLALGLMLLILLTGCSTEITDYQHQEPKLDIFHYFQGKTEAWGMVQDSNGKQVRRFHAEIVGEIIGTTLTLNEHFVYDNGERQQRVWHIRRTHADNYEGTADDIEGVAKGQASGNAFNWRYSMNVKADGSTWLLHFDDWMYLQDNMHLFNKTEMKKFGITVGTATLFFTRKTH